MSRTSKDGVPKISIVRSQCLVNQDLKNIDYSEIILENILACNRKKKYNFSFPVNNNVETRDTNRLCFS